MAVIVFCLLMYYWPKTVFVIVFVNVDVAVIVDVHVVVDGFFWLRSETAWIVAVIGFSSINALPRQA